MLIGLTASVVQTYEKPDSGRYITGLFDISNMSIKMTIVYLRSSNLGTQQRISSRRCLRQSSEEPLDKSLYVADLFDRLQ
jgi:hypothetical protein